MGITANATSASELSWLSEAKQAGPRLSQNTPVAIRHFVIRSGLALPHPEYHPYCEFGLHFSGAGVEFIEREQALREEGDLLIAGPGVPHWFTITRYPLVGTAIYFLPSVLVELGPERDGLAVLRRFTARQPLRRRLLRPPPALRRRLEAGFRKIQREAENPGMPGSEIRLRTLLMDMLVDVVRWEARDGGGAEEKTAPLQWQQVNAALHYLRNHFAEAVYARDVARAVGVSESRLKALFREALGMPWSRYIRGYRIQQAIALLGATDMSVTEVALSVGFESISHFNATFHAFMGLSPSAYAKQQSNSAKL